MKDFVFLLTGLDCFSIAYIIRIREFYVNGPLAAP